MYTNQLLWQSFYDGPQAHKDWGSLKTRNSMLPSSAGRITIILAPPNNLNSPPLDFHDSLTVVHHLVLSWFPVRLHRLAQRAVRLWTVSTRLIHCFTCHALPFFGSLHVYKNYQKNVLHQFLPHNGEQLAFYSSWRTITPMHSLKDGDMLLLLLFTK